MEVIAASFAQFMPYVFCMLVIGMVWDMVIRAFRGWL